MLMHFYDTRMEIQIGVPFFLGTEIAIRTFLKDSFFVLM